MRILSVLLALLILSTSISHAQDKTEEPQEPPKEQKEDLQKQQKAEEESKALIVELNNSIQSLSESLKEPEKRHFFLIYSNHNVISTVEMVRGDVGKAVESCGEKNPELKDDISTRYKKWDQAVGDKIKELNAFNNNMISVQNYTDKKNLTHITDLADKLRESTATRIKKIPITTKESCEFLLKKMDETQDNMISLLNSALLSAPELLQTEPEETETKTPPEDKKPAEN